MGRGMLDWITWIIGVPLFLILWMAKDETWSAWCTAARELLDFARLVLLAAVVVVFLMAWWHLGRQPGIPNF